MSSIWFPHVDESADAMQWAKLCYKAAHRRCSGGWGGSLSGKLPKEAKNLIEDMGSNECHWSTRQKPPRAVGLYKVHDTTALAVKVDALTKSVNDNTVIGEKWAR